MYKNNTILGLIPARGGSKGLPGKNLKPLLGKPLIVWTIEQALASKYLDRVVVSTDSEEIAEISRKYGAEVPFMRPASLATDDASSIDVVLHAMEHLRKEGDAYDLIMLLQPTSPLKECGDIDGAVELLFLKNAKAVVSVCRAEHNPCWMNTLPGDGCMKDFVRPEPLNRNRQNLPVYYRLNGAVYLAYSYYLRNAGTFFGPDTFAYIMEIYRSVDIDTETDFKFVEYLLKEKIT